MGVLEGKIAVITGGTTGIGAATARLFKAEGATVVVMGANPANIERAKSELGVDAMLCDVGSVASIEAAMASVRESYGRIDTLFANAGITGPGQPIDAIDEATFDLVIGVNLKGMLFTVQKALPMMGEGGTIVLTSSVGAEEGMVMNYAYGASKAGVRSLGRSLAAGLLPRGIRVNVLTPGLFRTPLFENLGPIGEKIIEQLKHKVPMARAGDPSEAAAAALFLASPSSSFMTGSEIRVSGGQLDL